MMYRGAGWVGTLRTSRPVRAAPASDPDRIRQFNGERLLERRAI
jgi:hypothetical protein